MSLLVKFNVIILLVLGSSLALATYFTKRTLDENARQDMENEARIIMTAMSAAREYTRARVKPLVESLEGEALSRRKRQFHFETVPAYSACMVWETMKELDPRLKQNHYEYREASLNPTKSTDGAREDHELAILRVFAENRDLKVVSGRTDDADFIAAGNDTQRDLITRFFTAKPMYATASCLECHGSKEEIASKPAWQETTDVMLDAFRSENARLRASIYPKEVLQERGGFGWKEDELVAAQVVEVPVQRVEAQSWRVFKTLAFQLGLVALVTIATFDLAVWFVVIRPINRLTAWADEVSRSEGRVDEFAHAGRDEIATMTASINRLRSSYYHMADSYNEVETKYREAKRKHHELYEWYLRHKPDES